MASPVACDHADSAAFVEGRTGVLDDCGRLIETQSEWSGNPNPFDPEDELEDEDTGIATDRIDTRLSFIYRACRWGRAVLGCGVTLIFVAWSAWAWWRLMGWVGSSLLRVPGPMGGVVGIVSVMTVLTILAAGTNRFNQARGYRRACKGESDESNRRMKFLALTRYNRCPACMYELDESSCDACGKVRCTECGACWIPRRWVGYLNQKRRGVYADLRKVKQRKACCLLDARGQIFRVLMGVDLNALNDRIRIIKPEPLWTERIKMLCMIIVIAVLVVIVIGISTFISTGIVGLMFGAVFLPMLLVLPFVLIRGYRRRFSTRRLQQLARELIDNGCCASCTGPLDENPHPIDCCRCCPHCGLAFDADTRHRRHHTRKRIPDELIGSDPVFAS